MELLIDGYNVLKTSLLTSHVDTRDRDHFLRRLAAYAKSRALKVTVVFDGGDAVYPYCTHYAGLQIWYSGQDSADDVLIHILVRKKGQELLLVTSDRELAGVARKHGVESVSAHDFSRYMHRAHEEREHAFASVVTPIKRFERDASDESTVLIDDLMKEVAGKMKPSYKKIADQEVQESYRSERSVLGRKKDRGLYKKIKKL